MATRRDGLHIHVGGKAAVVLFALSLVGFVTESQLTQVSADDLAPCLLGLTVIQYVQTTLEYRQPYLILCALLSLCSGCMLLKRGTQLYSTLIFRHNAPAALHVTRYNNQTIASGAMVPPDDHTASTSHTARR